MAEETAVGPFVRFALRASVSHGSITFDSGCSAAAPDSAWHAPRFVAGETVEIRRAPCSSGIEKGFDIVIGNPPYVRGTKFKELKDFFKKNFVTAQYQVDLYVLFIEKAITSLKENGVVSYITPNSWLKNLAY